MISRRFLSAGLAAAGLASAVGGRAAEATASPWPNGARAAVSLTYDDGLESQLDHGVGSLQAAGYKATFFLTRDNIGTRTRDWVRVARMGHEIGDHTMTHPCGLQPFTAESYARQELYPMEAWLDAHFGKTGPRVFAYPCSVTDLGTGNANAQFGHFADELKTVGFRAARTSDEDAPNSIRHVRANPYWLRASATTYEKDDPALAMAYVREAIKGGAWAILVFHDIVRRRTETGQTTVAAHEVILRWLKTQPIWCAPVSRVLDHIATLPA